jgi:hypothetical protein
MRSGMSLSFWLLLVPTVAYGFAAVVYGLQKNWPLAIVYWHYMGANIGLLWLDRVMSAPR